MGKGGKRIKKKVTCILLSLYFSFICSSPTYSVFFPYFFLQVTLSMKKIQSYVVLHAACIAAYTTIVIAQDARERLVFVA
jgi:hypothetical protein